MDPIHMCVLLHLKKNPSKQYIFTYRIGYLNL